MPRDQKPEITKEEATLKTKKLFVGGLPQTATEEVFKGYFEQFGKIEDWVIMVDKVTGKSRGFGFITFESEESVEWVISRYLDNKIDGKWVECKKAMPKDSANTSQTSTTNASPAVSNYSSKKNSMNKQSGESDLEIIRSILAQQQGAKKSVDNNDPEMSQKAYLESKLQAVAKLSDNNGNNGYWENSKQPEPSPKFWNEQQGEVEKGNYQIPQMYPYQQQQQAGGPYMKSPPPYNGNPYYPNYQQMQPSQLQQPQQPQQLQQSQQQQQQIQPRFMTTQEGTPYMGPNYFEVNGNGGINQGDSYNNEVYSANPNVFIQPMVTTKQESGVVNFPPGLNSFDGNAYPSNDPPPKKNSLTNSYPTEPIVQNKGSISNQQPQPQPQQLQQQQQPGPQKKVEKYIPLYS